MPFQNSIHMHDPRTIIIQRDKRQRKIFTVDDLKASIPKRGLINPITVNPEDPNFPGSLVLVAGERRLTTYLELPELGMIPCRYTTELSPLDLQIIELEENLKRQDLSWPEQVEAVLDIHNLYTTEDPTWTKIKTGENLGYSHNSIFRMLEVAQAVRDGNEKLTENSGWQSAYTSLENLNARKKESAMALLSSSIAENFAPTESFQPEDVKAILGEAEEVVKENLAPRIPNPFLNGDFVQWAKDYRGVPFNFIHMDPPYGVEISESDQMASTNELGSYEDGEEVMWEIMNALTSNLDQIMAPSAHMILWHSPKFGGPIREFLEKNAPDLWVQSVPLVWLKSDNRGIVADVQRRPRNITEFAFLISRGDRKLLKAVANAYAAPTSRVIHQSEKPIPVLKHFFQMFVDEHTRMLDPTSGSGNALVAADEYNAGQMLGIELSPEYYERSVQAWKKYKTLKLASESVE